MTTYQGTGEGAGMVTVRAFIEEGLGNAFETLHSVTDGLTHEQLIWRPTPQANPIGFILWHVGRVEDNFIGRFILFGDEVWASGGWQERFGYQTRGIGTGFTTEQVAEVPIVPVELVWGYLQEVREHTLQYLEGLDLATLPNKPRAERFPQWSIHTILRQLIAHPNLHAGEMSYLRGLQGLPGAVG